uniref:Ig-like domain-containing protein n=1 Tax=Prolemur simus TaxID=1328070 RepID=A0A8C8ZLQ0_PROSS
MCLLFSFQAGVRGLQVQQSPSVLSLQEGSSPTLRCNFSATVYSMQWFRQNPGGGLISLFFMTSGTKENGRLNSTMNSKELYSALHITATQLEDSGTYLCAAQDAQCSQAVCSLNPKCSWACSPTPSMGWGGRDVAPTVPFAQLWVF